MSSSRPQKSPFYFLFLWIWLLWLPHLRRIIQYLSFLWPVCILKRSNVYKVHPFALRVRIAFLFQGWVIFQWIHGILLHVCMWNETDCILFYPFIHWRSTPLAKLSFGHCEQWCYEPACTNTRSWAYFPKKHFCIFIRYAAHCPDILGRTWATDLPMPATSPAIWPLPSEPCTQPVRPMGRQEPSRPPLPAPSKQLSILSYHWDRKGPWCLWLILWNS